MGMPGTCGMMVLVGQYSYVRSMSTPGQYYASSLYGHLYRHLRHGGKV